MDTAPIIVVKRRRNHHAKHGGAWKVAYADFVTAMMALFIVLWLLSSSEQVKKAVGGYFADPTGQGKEVGNGLRGAGGESLTLHAQDMSHLKERLSEAIKQTAPLQKLKEHVTMTVTGEGLRVELSEGQQGAFFFESGNSLPTGFGRELLTKLATEIGHMPNKVIIEGHTDSKSFSGRGGYSNWELSSDRANSARRWMEENGVRMDQIAQVRGYADQKPRDPRQPDDPSNRRITLIIQAEDAAVGSADSKTPPADAPKAAPPENSKKP